MKGVRGQGVKGGQSWRELEAGKGKGKGNRAGGMWGVMGNFSTCTGGRYTFETITADRAAANRCNIPGCISISALFAPSPSYGNRQTHQA